MPRFAANLSMMFNELPFLERFGAAAGAGFGAVEFLFPYAFPVEEVGSALKGAGLTQALFNLPPGNWDAGERGMASVPGRERGFQASVKQALPYIEATGVKRVHMIDGHGSLSDAQALQTYKDNGVRRRRRRAAWRGRAAGADQRAGHARLLPQRLQPRRGHRRRSARPT